MGTAIPQSSPQELEPLGQLILGLLLALPKKGLEEAVAAILEIYEFHSEEPHDPRFGKPRFAGTTTMVIETVQRRPGLLIEEEED